MRTSSIKPLLSSAYPVAPLFEATILACVTMGVIAIDRVEKQIDKNIEDASKKRAVGKRRLKTLNWPRRMLKGGVLLWGLAAAFLAASSLVDAVNLSIFPPYLDIQYFWVGVLFFVLAGIDTGNVIAFMIDRKFKPMLTAFKAFSGVYIAVLLVFEFFTIVLSLLLLPRFFSLPLIAQAFSLSMFPSLLGAGITIYRVIDYRSHSRLYWVGVILFSTPVIILMSFGTLIRLGITF